MKKVLGIAVLIAAFLVLAGSHILNGNAAILRAQAAQRIQLAQGTICSTDCDCGADQTCDPSNASCVPGTNTCITQPPPPQICSTDCDCGADQTCDPSNGSCVPGTNTCIAPPPPPLPPPSSQPPPPSGSGPGGNTGGGAPGSSNSITLTNPISGCGNLSCAVSSVINFIFTLAIPILAIMIIVGGFQMLTATGNPEKFSSGKKTLLYSVIGFVVILLAGSVANLIQQIL